MRLAKLSVYRDLVYLKGSAPSLTTLRKRIREIPGGTILHGHYYVDLDKLEGGVPQLLAELRAQEREFLNDHPDLKDLI